MYLCYYPVDATDHSDSLFATSPSPSWSQSRSPSHAPPESAPPESAPPNSASQRTQSGVKPQPLSYEALLRENEKLRQQNRVLQSQKKHAEAHAAIAYWHIGGLTTQLNLKNARGGRGRRRTLKTHARCITTGSGALECEREDAEKRAEAARKAEGRLQKENQEAARAVERERLAADPTHVFSGALARKVKDELKLIALVLHLPLEAKKTNSQIVELITAHLQANADRYTGDPRFSGLYSAANGLATYQKQPLPSDDQDENSHLPTAHRIRLHSDNTNPLTASTSMDRAGLHTPPPIYPPARTSAPSTAPPSGWFSDVTPSSQTSTICYSAPGPSITYTIPTYSPTPMSPSPTMPLPHTQRIMRDLPPIQYTQNAHHMSFYPSHYYPSPTSIIPPS